MSNSLVIVALPEEDDRVHKISSEKAPHLTLLYLGDVDEVDNVDQIVQFVQHAVELSEHGQFYLDVDRRGTLGEEEADVIFFNKRSYNLKWIKQFRGQLLQNEAIRTAYDSTQQFGAPQEWVPHLTLGYPETPAKKPDEDDAFSNKLYSVAFDRISVWTGDSDGPEFRLEWPEREFEGDLAVAYSDAQKAALTHYGVKGMRWGYRKSDPSGDGAGRVGLAGGSTGKTRGAPAGPKLDKAKKVITALDKFGRDVQFENKVEDGRARNEVLLTAKINFKKHDLPAINSKPEYESARKLTKRLRNPRDPLVKKYRKEHREAYIQQLEKSANSIKNASHTREYTIRERGIELPSEGGKIPNTKYFWDVSSRAIKHGADSFEGTTTIEVILDEDGFITDLVPETAGTVDHGAMFVDALVHGATDPLALRGEEFILEHYGVKGMRWGQRNAPSTTGLGKSKPPPQAVSPTAVSIVPHGNKRKTKVKSEGGENHPASPDAIKVAQAKAKLSKSGPKALSNQELRDVAQRAQLESQAIQVTRSPASKYIRKLLGQQGNQVVSETIREGVREGRSQISDHYKTRGTAATR